MFILFLIHVLMGLALAVVLYVGTLWFQAYLYEQPAEELHWRAPAASSAFVLFMALWCVFAYRAPERSENRYDTLFRFSPRDEKEFPQFWSVKKRGENSEEILYERRTSLQGLPEYRDAQDRPWKRSDSEGIMEAIIVEENGNRIRLEAELTPEGYFPRTARYVEVNGSRFMTESTLGLFSTFRWGRFIANILLNLFHLALWFTCLWLLLRFQWSHALGLAAVLWLAMTLIIVPLLLDATRAVPRQKAVPQIRD